MALEPNQMDLKGYWAKTTVQVFGGLLEEAVQLQSVHSCGEDTEVSESFIYKYLDNVVRNSREFRQEVSRRTDLAYGIIDSLKISI